MTGDWICPNCGPLVNESVTYEETCTHCHHPVFWVDEAHELVTKAELDALREVEVAARLAESGNPYLLELALSNLDRVREGKDG